MPSGSKSPLLPALRSLRLIWLAVAIATPAPMAVVDVAKIGARHVHDRLPAEIRERLPEELRLKITGS